MQSTASEPAQEPTAMQSTASEPAQVPRAVQSSASGPVHVKYLLILFVIYRIHHDNGRSLRHGDVVTNFFWRRNWSAAPNVCKCWGTKFIKIIQQLPFFAPMTLSIY